MKVFKGLQEAKLTFSHVNDMGEAFDRIVLERFCDGIHVDLVKEIRLASDDHSLC